MEKVRKIRKELSLYPDTIEYLINYTKEHDLRSVSAAIDSIVRQHKNQKNIELLADQVVVRLEEKYQNHLTRIRLGTSSADVNSQIILEILNTMLINMNIKKSYMTNTVESDVYKESKKTVKDRIAHFKQIKDNKVKK